MQSQSRAIRSAPLAILLTSGLAALACAVGAAPVARAAATQTLVIAGAGDGHGVGMSQDGAYGYATHGWNDEAILAHYYTGTTIGQAPAGAVVRVLIGTTVHRVPLERYVRGVVSAEVPSEWPLAALEAQAIASRTYALTAHAGGQRFDVYSDTRSQVYRGVAAETAQTNAAVAATAGQIVTYAGAPAITYFFASSGGMTEDVQNAWPGSEPQPWLRGVPDPYDAGAQAHWKLSMSFATAAARLQGLVKGTFRGIEVLKRGYSPRVLTAAILGSAGTTRVSGATLAERLGLQDTWAYFSVRSGHGPVRPEPERGRAPATPITSNTTPAPSGPQGGARAPAGAQLAPAGGTLSE
ncbi:MAG TPA: SpoIID/LytB domain-containing protein [Solirubrobacteraceae bacterium]|jgi:stage II sporulation protein D|nr:SpoIID/LytB domain-containing protein [Solirubrobacteraceae bacterium]